MTSSTPPSAAAPTTLHQAFMHSAERWPSRPFVAVLAETASIYGIEPGESTYADCAARIQALRAAYAAAGYGNGHRVGLLLENRPAFFEHWFALNALGVSVVPINQDLRAAELEYLIGHSEIVLAVALVSRHADLQAAAARAGRPFAVISADVGSIDSNGSNGAAAEAIPRAPFAAPDAGRAPDELTEAALLYTSGTTGRPKGCILPNRYFLHAGRWYASIGGLAALRPAQDRMLTPLPLVHMNAMAYSAMAMVLTGGCLITLDRFHPGSWWRSVRESAATVVHYLGVMPAMLMKAEPSVDDRRHDVRFGFGAGVDRTLHQPFEQRFGFPLVEAWAMTETGAGAVIIDNVEPRQIGTSSMGREQDDVVVRLVADHGGEAGVDEHGELLVRHAGDDPRYGFFAGYLKDIEATDTAWADGWFHTGDVVRRDARGDLHFVDRKKNVIRRSGENISAVEVESVLQRFAGVKAVAVAAVPDAVRGDEVMACVVVDAQVLPAGSANATAGRDAPSRQAAMHDFATGLVVWSLGQLAYFKAPGYVAFVDSLPLTATNKIQRGQLKALAPTLVGTADCVDTTMLKRRQDVRS